MFKQCESTFNIERHLIPFLQDCPFFAELSRHITKSPTMDIPTAAVAYDKQGDQITLYYNPQFMASLSNSEIRGVLTHEFYHLVFNHLTSRRKKPSKLWNVATDLAINSLIVENTTTSRNPSGGDGDGRVLPQFALIPGQWPFIVDIPKGKEAGGEIWEGKVRELTEEERSGVNMSSIIASLPKLKSSEWYFTKLKDDMEEEKKRRKEKGEGDPNSGSPDGGEGDDWDDLLDSLDDHDSWDDIPEEQREYVAGKVKSMVEKAVRHADSTSTGWGSIPAELRSDIRKSVAGVVNWRSVLRQFVGNLMRGGRTSSIKRINRRYPYVHPGIKRGYKAKLLIARDESGSVSNDMLTAFFAELSSLTKNVDIDFVPFDCECKETDIIKWKKGQTPEGALVRTRMGGTDFNAPTKVFNDPKNRGRWDGLLIMTDGVAPAPVGLRGKRGWVLADGCKLEFSSDELQIFVTQDKPVEGAWR